MALPATFPEDELERCRRDLAAANEKIVNLETALETSRMIGCAIGILMAMRKVDYDHAFDLLRVQSQRSGRKIRNLAEEVVESGELEDVRPHAFVADSVRGSSDPGAIGSL